MDFGGLAVRVFRHDVFAEGVEAPHLPLNPASDVVSRPAIPECPAIVLGGAEGLVSGGRRLTVVFSRPPVLADWNDGGGLTVDDAAVAAAGVISPISGHRADLLALGDLTERSRQDRTVAVATGSELRCLDVRSCRIHVQMDLAPLAPTLGIMLAGLPFTVTKELDPGAVHQQVQRALGASLRDLDVEHFLAPAQGCVVLYHPVQACHLQQAGHLPGHLPRRQLEEDFDAQAVLDGGITEHGWATGLPSGGASQDMFLSSQISSDPRLRSEAVWLDQFVVR